MPTDVDAHPRVPLTRFLNNTGEFLDLASRTSVVLTSDGRDMHVVAAAAYFRRLEAIAAGTILEALDLRATPAEALGDEDVTALEASLQGNPRPQGSQHSR